MKLNIGKVYKVEFINKCGDKDFFYGQYVGIDEDKHNSINCAICGADNHKKGHQFNSYYSEDDYETFYFGTNCIKKCIIAESTWEEMLKRY